MTSAEPPDDTEPAGGPGQVPAIGQRPLFEVVEGGIQTTIQDLGRLGHEHEGVPRSGAADGLSLAIANALAGNPVGAPALEVTLGGLRLRVLGDVSIGLAGAELDARVAGAGPEGGGAAGRVAAATRPLEPLARHRLRRGEELVFEGRPEHGLGCRAYLAVPGGFAVPELLGSRSTSLVGAFGGVDGRALRASDQLAAIGWRGEADGPVRSSAPRAPTRLPADLAPPSPAQRIRLLPGPPDDEVGRAALERLVAVPWVVAGDSDRRGLRLQPAAGTKVPATASAGERGSLVAERATLAGRVADRPSQAVIPGTIQVTPSGLPLVLMPDAGTTGGYAVAALVIAADLPILGQLAPWDEVRFRIVDLATARAAAGERRAWLAAIVDRLGGVG